MLTTLRLPWTTWEIFYLLIDIPPYPTSSLALNPFLHKVLTQYRRIHTAFAKGSANITTIKTLFHKRSSSFLCTAYFTHAPNELISLG